MAEWLTGPVALLLAGRAAEDVETERWAGVVEAVRAYVEKVRSDLFEDEEPVIGGDIKLGASMLAARWYDRGALPGGVSEYPEMAGMSVRFDPDIAKLLGIGWSGDFVFGGGK